MNNNLELIYWTNNGGVELPLEDWQYKVIAQVLGLSIQEDKNGNFVKPTGSQKTSEIRYRENFWIKSLKNLDFTRV